MTTRAMLMADQVAATVRPHLEAPVDPATVGADEGSPGRTQVVRIGLGLYFKLYLRIGVRKPEREVAALAALVDRGLPVPRLVADGRLDDGRRWILMTCLAGRALPVAWVERDDRRGRDLQRALGRTAARLHAVPTPAFGAWMVSPDDDPVAFYRRRSAELVSEAVSAGAMPSGLVERIAAAQAVLRPALAGVTPVLVHCDLGVRNVLLGPGPRPGPGSPYDDVTGLFDFESSAGGDPLEDLRWVALHGFRSGLLRAFVDGYREVRGLSPDPDRLRYHALDAALDVFTYAGLQRPDLLRRAVHLAEHALARSPGVM